MISAVPLLWQGEVPQQQFEEEAAFRTLALYTSPKPKPTIPRTLISLWQGEVLEQQFGEEEAAFRTLDLYTSAVLEASLAPTKAPKPEWREVMAQMSKVRPPQTDYRKCIQQPASVAPRAVHALCDRCGGKSGGTTCAMSATAFRYCG